jgi:hypothetical protein
VKGLLASGAVILALLIVLPSTEPGAFLAERQPWQVQSRGLVLVDESESASETGLPPTDEDVRPMVKLQPTRIVLLRFPDQPLTFGLIDLLRILPMLLGLSVRPRRSSTDCCRAAETFS